jgi:hypothetical protein
MIANYRNGFVWEVMKRNPHIRVGLERAGFTGGWLEEARRKEQAAATEAGNAAPAGPEQPASASVSMPAQPAAKTETPPTPAPPQQRQ